MSKTNNAANDPANAKKTVAVIPPVMMAPPTHIDRWLLPKNLRQMDIGKKIEQTGVYHKWKMPLLAGAVLTRPSIKQPLVLNPHHPPHLPSIRAAVTLPELTSYNNSIPTFQNDVPRNTCHATNQYNSSPQMSNPIPFREPLPIRPELPPSSELQSNRPIQQKPVSNNFNSVIVTPPQVRANPPRSDLPPPANNPPQCSSNLLQPKTTTKQPGFHQNRIPGLIAIKESVMPPLIQNQPIPTMASPAPLANLGSSKDVQFKPVLKLKKISEGILEQICF